MKINLHNSTKCPTVSRTISVNDWLSKIKYGDQHLSTINVARKHGKGTIEYGQIKQENLPTVTFNYQFNKYLKLENAIEPTGVFYIDVDANSIEESIHIKEKLQQNNYIYATWLSLSEKGVGALVKSSVITPESFKQVLKQFCEEHKIPFDNYATKLTQYNVLSHDPNLYINPDSIEYNPDVILDKTDKPKYNKKVQSVANNPKKKKHIGTNCTFFRYHNLNDYWKKDDVVTNQQGYDAVELFLPITIEEGKRKITLMAFTNNLVWLNPDAEPEEVFKQLSNRNKQRCAEPLEEKELWDIIYSIYRYKEEGTLEPQRMKKRKIIFGPGCGMDKEEKRSFVNQTIGEWKKNKTQQSIYEALESWNFTVNGKITTKKVSEQTKHSLRTVKTYWAEFKDYVNELNQPYKQQNDDKTMKEKKRRINTQSLPVIKEEEKIKQNQGNELIDLLARMDYNERIFYLSSMVA